MKNSSSCDKNNIQGGNSRNPNQVNSNEISSKHFNTKVNTFKTWNLIWLTFNCWNVYLPIHKIFGSQKCVISDVNINSLTFMLSKSGVLFNGNFVKRTPIDILSFFVTFIFFLVTQIFMFYLQKRRRSTKCSTVITE